MEGPEGTAREPMGVEIRGKQGGLKEDEAGDPDGGGATEGGKELLGGHGFDEEEEECGEKDCSGEERS